MKQVDDFLNHLAYQKRYSPHTVTAYRNDLDNFCDFLRSHCDFGGNWPEVTHHMIREWIIVLMENDVSPRSINRKLSSLKSFFKYLMRQKVLEANPAAKISSPKQKKTLLRVPTEDELAQLLEESVFPDTFFGEVQSTLFYTFYHTGIRLSELINLKVSDIDFDQQKITVLGKRNKERSIPMTPVLGKKLSGYISKRATQSEVQNIPFLFLTEKGNKLYPKLVYNIINTYLSSVSGLKKKSPHVLRHSLATHMLNNGADLNSIKELLGHSNLAATQIYTHNSIDQLKKMYNQAHPRSDKNS